MKFTPKKIEVNHVAHTKAVKDAEEKINNFKEALDWVYSNNVSEVNDMAFNEDMLTEYKRCFMLQNSNVVKLDISFEKLLDLLDVDLQVLKEFQYKHDDNKSELVQIDNETVATKIDINDYTIWTKNEDENKISGFVTNKYSFFIAFIPLFTAEPYPILFFKLINFAEGIFFFTISFVLSVLALSTTTISTAFLRIG